jgi:hypothetical protein
MSETVVKNQHASCTKMAPVAAIVVLTYSSHDIIFQIDMIAP